MDLKKEWKEIKGYEGKYIVSNYGEIISLPRYKNNHSKKQYVEPKEIPTYTNSTNGYVYVALYKDGRMRNLRLHRLVAEAFVKRETNKNQINHIDGNKQNNRADNLEWCTSQENIRHAYNMGLKNNDKQKIKVNQYDLKGNLINSFNSISEASKITGYSMGSISLCLNDKRKTAYKYIWKRASAG